MKNIIFHTRYPLGSTDKLSILSYNPQPIEREAPPQSTTLGCAEQLVWNLQQHQVLWNMGLDIKKYVFNILMQPSDNKHGTIA